MAARWKNRNLMQHRPVFTSYTKTHGSFSICDTKTPPVVKCPKMCLTHHRSAAGTLPVWPSCWADGPLEVGGSRWSTLVLSSLHIFALGRGSTAELWAPLDLINPTAMLRTDLIKQGVERLQHVVASHDKPEMSSGLRPQTHDADCLKDTVHSCWERNHLPLRHWLVMVKWHHLWPPHLCNY